MTFGLEARSRQRYGFLMAFTVPWTLALTSSMVLLLSSCGGGQKKSDVPEGYKVCKYCCTTADIACSCEVLEVVECPPPEKTGILPACAECRSCTKSIAPEDSCGVE